MKTTLNAIRAKRPCVESWKTLLRHLGKTRADNKPLSILTILDVLPLGDALLCLRGVKGHDRTMRLYAVWCARRVQHLMRDSRSIAALDVAERFANGQATDAELAAALISARDAAIAAWDVDRAAGDDAYSVDYSVEYYAARAARDVAWDITRDDWNGASVSARYAADVAWAVARADAKKRWPDPVVVANYASRAWKAERAAQSAELRRICEVAE